MTKGKNKSYGKKTKGQPKSGTTMADALAMAKAIATQTNPLPHHGAMASTAVTPIEYSGLQDAYDHFNAALFARDAAGRFYNVPTKGKQRRLLFARSFFRSRRETWPPRARAQPRCFHRPNRRADLQTLVHEMAHAWQHHCGTPAARGYHNKEWVGKNEVDRPDAVEHRHGRRQRNRARMSDYIIPGGAFSQAYAKLAANGWKLNLQSAPRQAPKGTPTQQDQIHLRIVRAKRVGQTGSRDQLPAMRHQDAGRRTPQSWGHRSSSYVVRNKSTGKTAPRWGDGGQTQTRASEGQ